MEVSRQNRFQMLNSPIFTSMKLLLPIVLLTNLPSLSNSFVNAQTMFRKTISANWQFKGAQEKDWLPATVPGTVHTDLLANQLIGDPFYRTNEKEVQWIDKKDWEYQTQFFVEASTLSKDRVELVFEGLDTYADVYLNGQLILEADNFFVAWRVNVKPWLRSGENHLRIYFHSPIKRGLQLLKEYGFGLPAINDQSENGGLKKSQKVSVFTRKPGYHYGWDWGPRLVPSGIWRPITLEAWDTAKISDLYFHQQMVTKERALLEARFTIEATKATDLQLSVVSEGTVLAQQQFTTQVGNNQFTIPFYIAEPKRWWTRELGEPHLYRMQGQMKDGEQLLDTVEHRIGLRTIKVIREEDEKGESFYFELNGVAVFAKGANYIPNDVFIPRVSEEQYRRVINSATEANMNMLRVWGGGFYENDLFYQLCDEQGLLVWQDFMFACSMYPGHEDFLNKVKSEAVYNIRRLRNHASVALWCGNNEMDIAWSQYKEFGGWWWKQRYGRRKRKKIWQAYEKVFHDILPAAVKVHQPGIFYWPSSPYAGPGEHSFVKATKGDIHYWGVWHGKEPFIAFRENIGRFMSEYGFQSFPEFKTVQKYTIPEDWDIESEVMAAHQRSGIGNLRIRSYMEDHFRLPKKFAHLLYVGQLLQAKGMRMGIEAHRIAKPYCMGSLYWQLNDCWPVASWSSMDYYQNWKAMQYHTREAFKPLLIGAQQNKQTLDLFLVSDLLSDLEGTISLNMLSFNGDQCWSDSKSIIVQANTTTPIGQWKVSDLQKEGDFKKVVIEVLFNYGQEEPASQLIFLTKEKNLQLPKQPDIQTILTPKEDHYTLSLKTKQLAKNVFIQFADAEGFFSDNYFDLLPNREKTITFKSKDQSDRVLTIDNLEILTLADTY